MLHPDIDHLSIWEVAHRWHDQDPNSSDPSALPLPVQDMLRTITRMQYRHELQVCNENGIVLKDERTLVDFEHYVDFESSITEETTHEEINEKTGEPMTATVSTTYEDPENPLTDDERWERYQEFSDRWLRRHAAATKDFPQCFKNRIFERQTLERVHINKNSVCELCEILKLPLPSFWFTEVERQEHQDKLTGNSSEDAKDAFPGRVKQDQVDKFWSKLADKQKHRVLCREIAQELWKESPDLSIAEICKHDAIRRFGGGRYYTKPDTLRDWVKDLDPRPEASKKGGRPRST
jgi:hypothetical protein